MESLQATIGERLAARLREKKLRKSDLARALSLSDTAVGLWIKGDTKNLKLENLFAAADFLGVEARWLALGEGPKLKLPADAFQLEIGEAEMITRLRAADRDWRRYVLSLAALDSSKQSLMLATMREAVPDYVVERAYGTPGTKHHKAHSGSDKG